MVLFMGIFESCICLAETSIIFSICISMQGPTDREVASKSFQEF